MQVLPLNSDFIEKYDSYVKSHNQASVYHLSFFKTVIEQTYHHRSYYFVAVDPSGKINGILPLFFINSIIFGKALVSLPFCDYGGILANDPQTGKLLFDKALDLSKQLNCPNVELRQTSDQEFLKNSELFQNGNISVKTSKVRMKLRLQDSTEAQFSSFSAKLRSQIKKPQKEGCTAANGGLELLDDFYNVFVHNMRDLGSPVHTKTLMKRMFLNHPEQTRLFVVYHEKKPVACSLVSGFADTLVNPWASFKRPFQKIAPNMLLYWEMLIYAIENKYQYFDFGRSTPDEGTFKFKAQWGAEPEPLHWYNYCTKANNENNGPETEDKKDMFIKLWRKLPLFATRIGGPIIRRHIHL